MKPSTNISVIFRKDTLPTPEIIIEMSHLDANEIEMVSGAPEVDNDPPSPP